MFLVDVKFYALIILGLLAFLTVLGLITVTIYLAVRKHNNLKNKQNILQVRGKYLPMWGKNYLYQDAATGMVNGDCIGDKCEFFDNEEDAKNLIRSYMARHEYA